MREIIDEAGITVTKENRSELDEHIHNMVKSKYKDCPKTWKEVKVRIRGNDKGKKEFIKALIRNYRVLS
jgi:hypothetical protein